MSLQVSGLGSSGLDVQGIVSQLMDSEKIPQTNLSNQKTAVLARQSAWMSIGTQLTQVQSALQAVSTGAQLNSSTVLLSDSSVVSATASGSASASSVTFQVSSIAVAQQRASAGFASTSSVVGAGTFTVAKGLAGAGLTGVTAAGIADGRHSVVVKTGAGDGGTATLTIDGTDYNVTVAANGTVTAGGLSFDIGASGLTTGATLDLTTVTTSAGSTLADLAASIAGYGGPAAAAAIDTGSGATPARLVLSATNSGTANALSVSGTGGLTSLASGFSTTRPADDAVIKMGSLTITRPSNTITDLIPGVTLNLLKAAPNEDVTLNVQRDTKAAADKVKALVDSLNSLLDLVDKNTAYNVGSKTGQPLTGEFQAQQLESDFYDAFGSVVSTGTTRVLGQLGISLDRDGRFEFNSTTFAQQMTADPDGVTNLLGQAATAFNGVINNAIGAKGWLKDAEDSAGEQARDLQDQIDDWTVRLQAIQDRYTQQFSSLDAALNSMKNQQTLLAGQFARLAGMSTNNSS